jgi:hypothetical protein
MINYVKYTLKKSFKKSIFGRKSKINDVNDPKIDYLMK